MNYSELITLGVVTFGVALNAKCNNAKCNKLMAFQPKVFIILNSLIWVADAEMEKKDNTSNYLNAKLTESIYTTK